MMDINARVFKCRSASTNLRCGDDVLAQGVILVRLPPSSRALTLLMHFAPCVRLAHHHAMNDLYKAFERLLRSAPGSGLPHITRGPCRYTPGSSRMAPCRRGYSWPGAPGRGTLRPEWRCSPPA